jgi:putative ABC transport system substrate-binding protein
MPIRATRRRAFIKFIGGLLVIWPFTANAQKPSRLPTIGFLGPNTAAVDGPRVRAMVERLRELGWIEGRTVAIEYRWAEGRNEHLAEIASEFVRLNVNVIVTSATPPTVAAKKATSTIPVVFASAGDPIAAGLVTSLSRPGGNVTGLSLEVSDTAGKRLELLREAVPTLHHVAVMANVDNASAVLDLQAVWSAAGTLRIDAIKSEIHRAEDLSPAMDALKGRVDALYVCNDPLVTTNRARIGQLALAARLPTICAAREYVEAGNLMSYAANFPDLYRRTAEYVDKILRGAKPSDLPVEQPTKFDLVINLKTAKMLDLSIPPTMLTRADYVLE